MKYVVTKYRDLELINFGNNHREGYANTFYNTNVFIENETDLMIRKLICNKYNGKIEEKKNGEIVIEYTQKEYINFNDIELRYIENCKYKLIFKPIEDSELTNEFMKNIDNQNKMMENNLEFLF